MGDLPGDVPDEQAVADFLYVLDRHRIECEAQGKYDEAELAQMRLKQLQDHEDNRRREELRSEQLAERLGIEEAHVKELQEFNAVWDQKVKDFEAHAANLQAMLAERHQQEHAAYIEKVRRETAPRTPRWSRDLLNQRKIQETLAKQKNYTEAHKAKTRADVMEAEEHAKWLGKREGKMSTLEEQFLTKQRMEMHGLLKRIQSGREEQKQARRTELERLLQRYHNVKTQIESQQTIIRLRAEKYPHDWVHGSTSHFGRSTTTDGLPRPKELRDSPAGNGVGTKRPGSSRKGDRPGTAP